LPRHDRRSDRHRQAARDVQLPQIIADEIGVSTTPLLVFPLESLALFSAFNHATAPEGNVAGPAQLEKAHPQNSAIKKNLFMVNNFLKFLQALNDTTLYHP
jgi:hypothetical protein